MSVTLLDSLSPEPVADVVRAAVARLGPVGAVHVLHDERFASCQGCFECWVSHPGTCKVHDGANAIMRDVMAADEVIWTVRPRHRWWSATAKRALYRTIGLVLPHVRTIDGETHHVLRYDRYPRSGGGGRWARRHRSGPGALPHARRTERDPHGEPSGVGRGGDPRRDGR